MEQKNNRTPAFSRVRKSFLKQVTEYDRKENIQVIAVALSIFLLATALLITSTVIESSGKNRYVYVYGDYEQSINESLCLESDVQLIDMNALANYCGLNKEEAGLSSTFSVNNTYVSFEHNSKIAIVNGIKKEMPTKAQLKNGYCLVPLATITELFSAIEVSINKQTITVSKSTDTMYIYDKNPKLDYTIDASYLEYINSNNDYIYTLLNKQNPIDEDFEPSNLVQIPEKYTHSYKHGTNVYLEETTMKALEAMLLAMNEDGIEDVFVQSAYRTHAYQNVLFNTYIEREMEKGLSREQATINANKYSAKPEYSEHRTGLCIDFTTNSIHGAVDDVFETTEAYTWLKDNAWKYGFVMRYPENKEDITGYIYESWHYRFVGFEVASIMYQTGLCYEEYLEIFGTK